jgi:DNA-binding GntR family transcriptional regulator
MVHEQHHSIFEAIAAGQGYRAEVAMRGHISYAAQHIRKKYFAGKLLTTGQIRAAG